MSTFASLARRCATSLVAAQLVFGAVSVTSPALAAAPDQGWTLEQHGTWKSFTTTINGRRVIGVSSPMTAGRITAVLDEDGIYDLVIMDPTWHLDPSVCVPVALSANGKTYDVTGTSLGTDMIEMKNVSMDMLNTFVASGEAQIDVAYGRIVWTIDLHGFADSMTNVTRLYQASS